jgi:hypothetical protein
MSFQSGKLFLALTLAVGCLASAAVAADDAKLAMAEGKVTAEKPEQWEVVQPKMRMIQFEFAAPKDAAADDAARITIMQASGSIEDNINRWIGQFEGATKDDAKVEKKEVEGGVIHTVDLKGTFVQTMGGPFAPGPSKKLEDHRLLGAIIETKDHGKIFVKMTGPAKTVEDLSKGMHGFLESVEIKP